MNNNTNTINKEKLLSLLSEYISVKERRNIKINFEDNIIYGDLCPTLQVKFYEERYINGEQIRVYMKEEEIKEALTNYTKNLGRELEEYKYDGGVRLLGYFSEEDTAIFQGVILYFKDKKYTKKRTR